AGAAATGFAAGLAFVLACLAMHLLVKSRRFKKWMAENLFAACSLHFAWMLADTLCFGAALAPAGTTNAIATVAAMVVIRTFFIRDSSGPSPLEKRERLR